MIPVLRSQLSFYCDLPNITVSELTECKWSTKRNIILAVMGASPGHLCEQHQRLLGLVEARALELRKNGDLKRTLRHESEQNFRMEFMKLFLETLEYLRWPPAREAFSNPLPNLLGDNEFFISAVSYVINTILVPKDSQRKLQDQTSPQKLKYADRLINTKSAGNVRNEKLRLHNTNIVPTKCEPFLDVQSISKADLSFPTVDDSKTSELSDSGNIREDHNISTHFFQSSCNICRSMEVLQLQNESLSKQLRALQQNIFSRESAEMKLSTLIHGLVTSLREIVDISESSPSRQDKIHQERKSDYKPAIPRINLHESNGSKSHTELSTVIWKGLLRSVLELHDCWEKARFETRKIAFSSVDAHARSIDYIKRPHNDLNSRKTTKKSQESNKSGSFRILTHQVFGVRAPLSDLQSQPLSSIPNGLVLDECEFALDLPRIHHLQRDLLHFAHRAYNALEKIGIQGSLDEESSRNTKNEKCQSTRISASSATPLVSSAFDVNMADLQGLHTSAIQLMLRLSALAPLAPLTISGPLASSSTGLEALIGEIQNITNGRKSQNLQRAIDRAVVEQSTLIRCFVRSLALLKNVSTVVTSQIHQIKAADSQDELKVRRAVSEIKRLEDSALSIFDAYEKANGARISVPPIPSKEICTGGSTLTAPLDMLARGVLGIETASLINTIRTNAQEISDISTKLADIRNQLYTSNIKLPTQTDTTTNRLRNVANLCDSFLSSCSTVQDLENILEPSISVRKFRSQSSSGK